MRGLALYAAIILFVLFAPVVLSLAFWPFTGGLPATLDALGLTFLQGPAALVLSVGVVVMAAGALANAKGQFQFRQHTRDIAIGFALPWLLVVLVLKVTGVVR
jgi:hypothetical protein